MKEKGSVTMEFLMVLPIYFALIGGTFWIGELLLGRHNLLISDRLASNHWGVRHDRENDKRNPNDKTMLYRLNVWLFDVLSKDIGNTPIASKVVQTRALRNRYAWAQTTGGKVSLWMPQPSWIKSWLHGYDDTWEETLEGARASQSFNLGSCLAKIPDDVFGMNSRVSSYNFLNVSLMRTKVGEFAYRSWSPAQLCHECSGGMSINVVGTRVCMGVPVVDSIWYDKNFDEKFPYHNIKDLERNMSENERDDASITPHDHEDYIRFPSYVLWSQ